VDLAAHRRAYPAPPRPPPRRRPAPTMATTRTDPHRRVGSPRPGSGEGSGTSARRPREDHLPSRCTKTRQARPWTALDGHPVPPTAVPHPITTSGKRSNARPHSPPDSGRQLKRQDKSGRSPGAAGRRRIQLCGHAAVEHRRRPHIARRVTRHLPFPLPPQIRSPRKPAQR
jgi:hypothetical protein